MGGSPPGLRLTQKSTPPILNHLSFVNKSKFTRFPFLPGCREAQSQTLCSTAVQVPGTNSLTPCSYDSHSLIVFKLLLLVYLKVRDLIFLYYGSSYGINNKEEKNSMRTGCHSSSGVPLHHKALQMPLPEYTWVRPCIPSSPI